MDEIIVRSSEGGRIGACSNEEGSEHYNGTKKLHDTFNCDESVAKISVWREWQLGCGERFKSVHSHDPTEFSEDSLQTSTWRTTSLWTH